MSDHVKSYNDSVEQDRQPMHSYQSLRMSRWLGTSCNAALQEHDQSSSPLGYDEDDHGTKQRHLPSGVEIASDISGSAKGLKEVKPITFEIINESPAMSSRSLGIDKLGSLESPIVELCQKTGSSSILKIDQDSDMKVLNRQFTQNSEYGTNAMYTTGIHYPSKLSEAPPATETSLRECCIQHQSVSQTPKDMVKSCRTFGSSFAFLKPLQDNFKGTTSRVYPQGLGHGEGRFESGRIAKPSFICSRQEKANNLRSILASKKQLSDTNLTILEQETCDHPSHSEFLVGKKNTDNCSSAGKSVIPYLQKENDSCLLVNDPSTSNIHPPVFCEEQCQKMQNHSAISLFPSWSSSPEKAKLDMLHHGRCLHTKPTSAHDASKMRIRNSSSSVRDLDRSLPDISQTNRSLLITKKTDVNLCKENQNFRDSRVLAQVKENSFSERDSFSQLCGHGKQGTKLQLLCSSSDSEGKNDVQDVNALEVVPKNDSSAETDTMDMDKFRENHLSGANSSSLNKDVMLDTDLLPSDAIASPGKEVRCRRRIPELPDINIELPALPAAGGSMDNAEVSTSRTQSLDMDLLLHAEKPSNSKSNHFPDGHLGPESSSRWIKRLKLSGSCAFSLGTKSMNLGEAASHEKVNKLFSKTLEGEIINIEPTLPECAGKELMLLDQKTATIRNADSPSVDNVDKDDNITLSHSWIQRWRRNRPATPQKKPEALVVCDPQSSKLSLEDFQKKQFPSIAAMALMGKAMNGFQPCKIQNRGSFTVWNTKG